MITGQPLKLSIDVCIQVHAASQAYLSLPLTLLLNLIMCKCFILQCSPCSPWWPFPYLVGVGLVLLLHSFRSRATSWVTPTPAMSSFICWCHVFLGRPRRVVWYCQLHHSAGDVGCISSLNMSKPTKTATAHNLFDW